MFFGCMTFSKIDKCGINWVHMIQNITNHRGVTLDSLVATKKNLFCMTLPSFFTFRKVVNVLFVIIEFLFIRICELLEYHYYSETVFQCIYFPYTIFSPTWYRSIIHVLPYYIPLLYPCIKSSPLHPFPCPLSNILIWGHLKSCTNHEYQQSYN